jgi:hypothetical protein
MVIGKNESKVTNEPSRLRWLKKWQRAPFYLNFYPCMSVLISYVLLLILPENILSLHPSLLLFTNFMSGNVPSISIFTKNVAVESILLVNALLWTIVPCWIKLYYQTFKPLFKLTENEIQVYVNRGDETIWHALFRIVAIVLAMWICWSGYPFVGSEAIMSQVVIFNNKLGVVFFTYLFSNGFLILLISLPAFLRLGFIVYKLPNQEK